MNDTTALMFEYKWWRLKEGLTHQEFTPSWGVPTPPKKEGVYMLLRGSWYQCLRQRNQGAELTWLPQKINTVPKEVRTLALLLT